MEVHVCEHLRAARRDEYAGDRCVHWYRNARIEVLVSLNSIHVDAMCIHRSIARCEC